MTREIVDRLEGEKFPAWRRKSDFPLSSKRLALAETLIEKSKDTQGFYKFRSGAEVNLKAQPETREGTLAFQPEIDNYFGYRFDYYPFFDQSESSATDWFRDWPWRWRYFTDIDDEIIEQKFAIDQDVRSFITAFRLVVERNRLEIIKLKRWAQALALAVVFVPVLLLGLGAPLFPLVSRTGAIPDTLETNLIAIVALAAVYGVVSSGFIWARFKWQEQQEDALRTAIEGSADKLSKAMQGRVNNLGRNFIQFLANIDAEEATRKMSDPTWTEHSGWWMQLSMWSPKRIEYIEKFFQSEMQRIRVYMLVTRALGRGSAYAVFFSVAGVSLIGLAIEFFLLGLSIWTLAAAGLMAVGLIRAWSITQRSRRSTVTLELIKRGLGEEPLGFSARFADLELHRKLAEQIRKDKEKIRQSRLAGGGLGDGAGRS